MPPRRCAGVGRRVSAGVVVRDRGARGLRVACRPGDGGGDGEVAVHGPQLGRFSRRLGGWASSHSCSARATTSRSGRPMRRATRAASSCSTFTRPAPTFTRTARPSTSTGSTLAGLRPALQRWPRTPSDPVSAMSSRPPAGQRRIGQGADGVGGPALLHDDRRDPGVVGAGVEQRGDGVGQHLAGGVVDVDLEQHDRLAVGAARPARVADHDLDHVGALAEVGRPAPKPMRPMVIAGIGPHPVPVGGQQRGAGRRGQLDGHVEPVGRGAGQQLDDGRGRDRAAGRGRRAPCRCRGPPALASTSSTPSTSSAAQVPTTSTMASMPPTSWKWTLSGGRRWRRPSASASRRRWPAPGAAPGRAAAPR